MTIAHVVPVLHLPKRLCWSARCHCLLFFALLVAATISGCASIPTSKPLAPKVTVAGVVPLNLSLTETRLNFTLRVANPNSFDLPLQNLDFIAYLGGDKIAVGNTNQPITIPANGETMMDVVVTTGLSKLWGHMKSMLDQQTTDLNYTVTGQVKLKNWPKRIPFNVAGELEKPKL